MNKNLVFEKLTLTTNEANIVINNDFCHQLHTDNFLVKLANWEELLNTSPLFFRHQKRYRQVIGLEIDGLRIYIKRYLQNFQEAEQEWKNILFLWAGGFPTSIPIFFYKSKEQALVATQALEGKTILEYDLKNTDFIKYFIQKIATYLANLHREKIFHQDCYLNHFYWDEEEDLLYLIDVSRLLHKPLFSTYYQIKDLSQLRFSFYTYLGEEWKDWWDLFLKTYEITFKKSFPYLKKLLIYGKFYLIKRHTEKHLKIDLKQFKRQ